MKYRFVRSLAAGLVAACLSAGANASPIDPRTRHSLELFGDVLVAIARQHVSPVDDPTLVTAFGLAAMRFVSRGQSR